MLRPRLRNQTLDTAAEMRKMARLIEQDLRQCERLQKRMDLALGDTLFLPNEDPVSTRNLQRFRKYLRMLTLLTQLKFKLIHEFMRVHGVNPDNPSEMWRTAAPVGALSPQTSYVQPDISKQSIQVVSEEVIRLATHLTKHAHTTPVKVESYETASHREKCHARRRAD